LFFAAMLAALAAWLVEAVVARTAIPDLDWIVSFSAGAALVTIFVVAGVANSLNIIDGFNGLSSMCGVLSLVCLCYVCSLVGDPLVTLLALVGIGAMPGFFVWNFPAGPIFLGDGWGLPSRLLWRRAGHLAAASQSAGLADVPAAAVHLPCVRGGVLHLPAQGLA
jgi:UDP-N-acetylmuramyl pentapeptide phosphotransferase/UDP-N-acetylglucosamine-1-phosphate transferase